MINLGTKLGAEAGYVRGKFPRTSEIPFDSDRKLMSTAHVLEMGPVMVTKGAVDVLLNRVTKIKKGTEICPITKEDKEAIENQNQEFSRGGLRVLAFAYKPIEENKQLQLEDEQDLIFGD